MVSTRKIAKEAGVSVGTVSRVLNNKAGVSEETRRRVMQIAQELNYALPRRLPFPKVTMTHVGLLVKPFSENSILANPFYADVYHGVEQACSRLGLHLAFNVLEIADEQLRKPPMLLRDDRMGGLIVVGALPQPVVQQLATAVDLPLVMVDNWDAGTPWDCVMMDNARGTGAIVDHLVQLGHERIVFVTGPDDPSIVERRQGYEDSMRRHGLMPQVIMTENLTIGDGEVAATLLLQDHEDTTAAICSNDLQAVGLMHRLIREGYRIPEDIAVAGFDDIQMAGILHPPLTTVHVDRLAFGQLAVDLLLGRVNAPQRPTVRCTMSVHLVCRESTVMAARTVTTGGKDDV